MREWYKQVILTAGTILWLRLQTVFIIFLTEINCFAPLQSIKSKCIQWDFLAEGSVSFPLNRSADAGNCTLMLMQKYLPWGGNGEISVNYNDSKELKKITFYEGITSL